MLSCVAYGSKHTVSTSRVVPSIYGMFAILAEGLLSTRSKNALSW